MGLLQTMRGVGDSGAPEEYTAYLESDPTPMAFAQMTLSAWNDLHDDQGLVLRTPEVQARLAAVAEQLRETEPT